MSVFDSALAWLVATLAEHWPSPSRKRDARVGGVPGTIEYDRGYAREQLDQRVRAGLGVDTGMPSLVGKEVLEIGCGHGGLTCFLAGSGARRVVGIDVNEKHLDVAKSFAAELGYTNARCGFMVGDALSLPFDNECFDVVVADNLFEHVPDPGAGLAEVARVLRPGGALVVPTFSSIRSKYGLHLKHGLKLPWLNLIFPERVIVAALHRRAARHPHLVDVYPGLASRPVRVRDVRRHRDLNDITHTAFLAAAHSAGLRVHSFRVHATLLGRLLRKLLPFLERTALLDILSTGAGAVLTKPSGAARDT